MINDDRPICTALTHLITPQPDLYDTEAPRPYCCCVNAGVAKVHLGGVPACKDNCTCHEMPEGWRPGADE